MSVQPEHAELGRSGVLGSLLICTCIQPGSPSALLLRPESRLTAHAAIVGLESAGVRERSPGSVGSHLMCKWWAQFGTLCSGGGVI